ncbi:putative SCF ubiquitin ligase complex subunit SKP2 [Saccharomyces paradoxus]|uniref:SCF ubiquitin ligase complex subunit SKP2 n=1 Tax=Saccharomyces paradoxus TaxID=27291 RepID=A0A8B8UY65_SACPA|nr:Skp2 [Saccharomyces paradoxus]QHS75624.1 Skp2 [Saccharomyces paradoxus]
MKRLQLLGRSKYFSLVSGAAKEEEEEEESNPDAKSPLLSTSNVIRSRSALLNDKSSLMCLPTKVLLLILRTLDFNTLVTLCLVNSRFYNLITNEFLFQNVILDSKLSLLKFNALIHSEFHTSNIVAHSGDLNTQSRSQNARFLVRSIEFKNPQSQDSLLKYSKFYNKSGQDSIIAGSYKLDSYDKDVAKVKNIRLNDETPTITSERIKLLDKFESNYFHYTYIELMLDIIDYLPNLSKVILSEVEPNFKIPLWYSVFNDGSRDFFKKIIKGQQSITNEDLRTFQLSKKFVKEYESKYYSLPRLKILEIKANNKRQRNSNRQRHHQKLILRPSLFCCFGIISELKLENVTIDTESLDTPMEFLPLFLKNENTELYSLQSPITALTLNSCDVVPGNGILRLFHSYFKMVKHLSLLKINSKFDLLLCSCFPSLSNLTIDCNSECFTDEQVVSEPYYFQQRNLDTDDDFDDCNSMTETLFEAPSDSKIITPPPTSSVVLSLNLNYISRTTGNDVSNNPSPNNNKKPAILTAAQLQTFQRQRIPEFHSFYHYYRLLWERLPSKNISINVINIPFTNVYPLSPLSFWEHLARTITSIDETDEDVSDENDQETLIGYESNPLRDNIPSANAVPNLSTVMGPESDIHHTYYWNNSVRRCLRDSLIKLKNRTIEYRDLDVEEFLQNMTLENFFNDFQDPENFKDIPNINLWCFLRNLSKFKAVKIRMLRHFSLCTPRTRYDWELLLKPVLRVNVPIEVRDKDGFVLYSYGQK